MRIATAMTPRLRRSYSLRSIFVVALLIGVAAACALLIRETSRPSVEQVQKEGDRLVLLVQKYHEAHGRYPRSLAEAGLDSSETRYGPWRYQPYENAFSLAVGNYMRDGFTIRYASHEGKWRVDQ